MSGGLEACAVSLGTRLARTDLVVAAGQMVALVGPNGSGKTSLLRALARVEGAGGTVRIDGEEIDGRPEARRRRLVAFLPASRDIAWPIGVADLVRLGLSRGDDAGLEPVMGQLDLGTLRDRPVDMISTGERSRALIARVLVGEAKLLLLDEPLANLDPYWTLRTIELLRDRAKAGTTALVALHDLAQVAAFDRLLLMSEGRVVADGSPDELADELGALFGVEQGPHGWRIRR